MGRVVYSIANMSEVDRDYLMQCWGERPSGAQCKRSVPADPSHPGLCDDCLAAKRREPRPCLAARVRQALA